MIFNQEIINYAISKLKTTEYSLDGLDQKLRALMKDLIESGNHKSYRRLEVLSKEINEAKEEARTLTNRLSKISDLYETYARDITKMVDDLPLLIDSNILSEWISNILIYGVEDIKNETNPMLCNNRLQHEDWLINKVLNTLSYNGSAIDILK